MKKILLMLASIAVVVFIGFGLGWKTRSEKEAAAEKLGQASVAVRERTGVKLPRPDIAYRREVKENGIVEAQGMVKTINDDGTMIFDYGTGTVTLKQDENTQLFAAVHTGPTPQPAVPLSETGKDLYEGAQAGVVYPEATLTIVSLVLID